MLGTIFEELKNVGKDIVKSFIGAPSKTIETATYQVAGTEKSAETIAKEEAEEKKREAQIKQNLHEKAQMLGVAEEKPAEPTDEELKAKEEEEKKKKELPPLEVPAGKRTGEIPLKRAQTQIEDKQGYKG